MHDRIDLLPYLEILVSLRGSSRGECRRWIGKPVSYSQIEGGSFSRAFKSLRLQRCVGREDARACRAKQADPPRKPYRIFASCFFYKHRELG